MSTQAPYQLRAQLSIDANVFRKKEDRPNEYGGVYGHPVANAGDTIQLIVTTYPANAAWKLEFENYSNPAEDGVIHVGNATIDLPVPDRFGPEYRLHRVKVKPAGTAAPVAAETVVSFWSWKAQAAAPYSALYQWNFADGNWNDSQRNLPLTPVGAAETTFDSAVAIRGRAARVKTPGLFENENVPLDATAGATLMGFVRASGRGSFGFMEKDKNDYQGNCFEFSWSYWQPYFSMPRQSFRPQPFTTIANRWAPNTWNHIALVITPIEDFTAFPGVAYDAATDRYTWTSVKFGGQSTSTWLAHHTTYVPVAVDTCDFYIIRSYVNGVQLQETVFHELKSLADSPAHCLRTLGGGWLRCSLESPDDLVDELTIMDSPLTESQIIAECIRAGVLPPEKGVAYQWDFDNETLVDSKENVELLPVGTAAVTFSSDNSIHGKCLRTAVAGDFENTDVPFDATGGATLMAFVRGSGVSSAIGFQEKNKNDYDGNHFLFSWSYAQPYFCMPRHSFTLKPNTSTANRWSGDNSIWHHMAMTITPIEDLTVFPGVTYDAATNRYTWISKVFGSAATASWPARYASNARNGVDGCDFYIIRSYVDGVQLQEMVFQEEKSLAASPDHCLRKLGNNRFAMSLKALSDTVDDLTVLDYALTGEQIVKVYATKELPLKVPEALKAAAIEPAYLWDFDDETLVDSKQNIELTPLGTAAFSFTDENSVRGKCVKPVVTGIFENTDVPFDATGGATLMAFVRGSGSNSGFGFQERGKNDYSGNQFHFSWSFYQPYYNMPRFGMTLKPFTRAVERWSTDVSLWHHVAQTITPIEDLAAFPGVTYDAAANRYTWVSTKFGDKATASWPAHYTNNARNGVDGCDFYIIRSYKDGVLLQEMIFQEEKSLANSPNHCLRTLGGGRFYLELNNASDAVDELTVLAEALTEEQIRTVCLGGDVHLAGAIEHTLRTVNGLIRSGKPDISTVKPVAHLKAWAIDANTIAVGGDYMDWFRQSLLDEFGDTFPGIEWNHRHGLLASDIYDSYHKYALWTLYADYQPLIRDNFDTPGFFQVNGTAATLAGRWSNSNRGVAFPDLLDGTKMVTCGRTFSANIIHFAYLSLDTPMVEGETYTITDSDGNSTTLTYGVDSPSPAIKVNQSGYSPSAGKRYGYLGLWLGTGGAYTPATVPANFHLVPKEGGAPVFTGPVVLRKSAAEDIMGSHTNTGEIVWELDFSSFNTEGDYRIHIPGIGYSYPFEIGVNAIGRQFYYSMWGLFQQRSGCRKQLPHTKWECPEPGQSWTFGNKFCTEGGYAYALTVDESNRRYDETLGGARSMIPNNMTGEIFRDIRGGWMDAADFDKREYHLQAVDILTMAYLLHPENFTDNQLHIPESGNGIPDILGEAEWGLDVWRRAQHPSGGISCWIEAKDQESGLPWESDLKYCLSEPSCHDSMKYAFSAARLARCLTRAGTPPALAKAAIYRESAERAFQFGIDPANHCTFDFVQNGAHWTHTENPEEAPRFVLRAAAALYALTNNQAYALHITQASLDDSQRGLLFDDGHPSRVSPELLFELKDEFPVLHKAHRTTILQSATNWVNHQEYHAYRWLYWGNGIYPYYTSWGKAHPGFRGWILLLAAKLLEGQDAHQEYDASNRPYSVKAGVDYRTAAHLALDWSMGCNAFGRSMTSGVGANYPVWYLCSWLPNSQIASKDAEGRMIEENVPGITPYQFSVEELNGNRTGVYYVYRHERAANSNFGFAGSVQNLLPAAIDATDIGIGTAADKFYRNYVPLQRQYVEVGDFTVAASEFTIWETVAPLAALAGCLMGPGFAPNASWKLREPIRDRYALDGYIFLP